MPYEVQLEDGMRIQVSSLNGHDWSDYHEKLLSAAREARRATLESDYATVLAIIKSGQRPKDIYKQQCLTRWQLQMAKQVQRVVENDKATERVNEDTAAAWIPDHEVAERNTDSISLATPVSSPQDHDTFVKLTKTREIASTTTPQRTPCDKSSHREDQRAAGITRGGGADEEKGRASVDRPSAWTNSPRRRDGALTAARSTVSSQDDDGKGTKTHRTSVVTQKPQTASPAVDEKTGDAENPNAECAGPTRSADSSHEPPVKPPLEEQGGELRVKTRVSEVSREVEDGPGEDSDEEYRSQKPDEPTSELRVESGGPTDVEVKPGGETDVERNRGAGHEVADAVADGGAEEALQEVQDEVERSTTRRNASIKVARWCASAHIRSTAKVEETVDTTRPLDEPPSVELEGERIPYPSDDVRLTSAEADALGLSEDDEDARDRPKNLRNASERADEPLEQRSRNDSPKGAPVELDDPGDNADALTASETVKDVWKRPKKLGKALKRVRKRSEWSSQQNSPSRAPDEPNDPDGVADASAPSGHVEDSRNRPKAAQNASERVGKRSERRTREHSPYGPQVDPNDPGDEADTSVAPWSVEDVGKMPRKLRKVSEPEREHSKRRCQGYSPRRAQGDPDNLGGETVVPDDLYTYQEGPTGGTSEDSGETSASDRDTKPGGCRGEQVESRGTEGDSDCASAIDRAELDGIGPGSDRDEHVGDTNPPCRDRGLGGRLGEQGDPGDVEDDRERQSDGNGVETDGIQCRMDGATSGPRCDSTRVETDQLAEDEPSQCHWYKYNTMDVPRPSAAPTDDHRLPTNHPNPPRRCGRIKTRPTSISTSRWTYRAIRTCQGRIRRIGRVVHVIYEPEMVQESLQGAICEDGDTRVD